MIALVDTRPYLRPERLSEFVLREDGPWLVRRDGLVQAAPGDPVLGAEWAEKQAKFIGWTQDAAMFAKDEVERNYAIYDGWFRADPGRRLTGRLLDIGGGWGLFREWWDEDESGCYVVHDPGVERFTVAPPETLRRRFARGLARPALFVEGVGEDLPYREASYDTVCVISALDHCARPAGVLAEAHRVLAPGGRLFAVQGFEPEPGERLLRRGIVRRVARVLTDPRRLYRALRTRLRHGGDPHLHHFTRSGLRALIADAGYVDVRESVLDERFAVAVVEARKPR